ncbi:uncharacterized protein K02A2.6-like [Bombyx mori]|uniref:RNA-directed DNA polymerase n=1 Tax=Bombyx mori TaxID=7091 RepID=A0A8R2M9T9_BOMMO|nr:uncharacterized protein K02A2.6-like [Bombyx mori]
MSVGQLKEFAVNSGNWSSYVDRLEMYFLVNKVTDDLKLPTLISVMGEEAYDLLSTLASPSKPSQLTYANAVAMLAAHLQPKPSILAERYKFRQRRQLNESIADYVTELKKLSKNCEFGSSLDENLRDQMVCGLKSEIIRQRLFAEEKLEYKRAVTLALSLEAAERDAIAVERTPIEEVNKINFNECSRCGDRRHQAKDCIYKDYVCSSCHETGHLRRMCPKKGLKNQAEAAGGSPCTGRRGNRGAGGNRRSWRGQRGAGRGGRERAPLHLLYDQNNDDTYNNFNNEQDGCGEENEPMYQMTLSNYKPVCIKVKVQNCLLKMEVDTGSALSCISKNVYDKYFSKEKLQACLLNLKFYDGSIIRPLGFINTIVKYQGVSKMLDLYVIHKGTTNLLGRQWLAELNIPIKISKPTSFKIQHSNFVTEHARDYNKLINEIVSRHKSLFDGTLGKYTGGTAELIVRPDAVPIYCRARPLPYALRERVDAELDAMLAAGVIKPVDHSDWATPLVVVRKADGGLRICADYKVTLNKVLAIDRFPVPKMEDLFSNLSGNKFFTKLDLSQAYNQIVLSEHSSEYTVINTHRGLFKYSRLVYGLASSPGIFQKLMVNMFKNVPNVVVFYDDILIRNQDLDSHLKSIKEVLDILERYGLKIKRSKCEFMVTEVRYLGFIIDQNGVRVDPEKVKSIATMPHPNNVTELKSFIGMVNFYSKFIQDLSAHLSPLYALLKKGKHWMWGNEQNAAFLNVKKFLCSTKALAHFDMSLESVLTVDASARGLGAVLAQRGPGCQERVVAYASRALTTHELHYSQIHKEALAIVFAVEKFHQYLYGRKFILRTDHKPLVSIFGPNIGIPSAAASRLQRWAIKLSAYDFEIEYVRTDKNVADALSRLIESQKNDVASEETDLPEQTYLHFSTEALLIDYNVLKKQTSSDPILSRVLSYIRDGWPLDIEINELKPYYNRKNELYIELGCIMWGHRVVIPSSCRNKIITELHDPHMGIVKTKSLARSYVWWPGIDEALETECRACTVCAAVADAPSTHAPRSWPWPSRPWSRLHLDFLGPIGGVTYLVVVDSCSKWIEAIKMQRTTAQAVISVLRDLWSKFGLPKQTVSDNGPPFSSSDFQKFLIHNGIKHIYSAPYHSASNGAAENAVKICKRAIKKALKQNLNVDTALCRFLLAYRNTEHATTGDSPANILQGRSLRMRLDNLKPERQSRVIAQQERSEQNAGGVQRQLEPGTKVWYRDYRGLDKWVPGTILKQLGSRDYCVRSSFGTENHRHVDQLKLRVTKNIDKVDTFASIRKNISPELIAQNLDLRTQSRKSLSFPMTSGEEPVAVVNDSGKSSSPPKNSTPAQDAVSPIRGSPMRPTVPIDKAACSTGGKSINENVTPKRERPVRIRKPPVRYGFEEID